MQVLTADSLEILKSGLTVNPYTDQQLHYAAMWYVAPSLSLAEQLGAADASSVALFTTANLFARTIMAEYMNKGLLPITAIERYMKYAEEVAIKEATNESGENGANPDAGVESSDVGEAPQAS